MLAAIKSKKCTQLHLPNIDLAVSEWGDLEGEPIIALHGWLDNMASFYPLIAQSDWLVENKIRLITFDLPGHGHSAHRHPSHPYNLVEYVQDLHDLIEHLELENVTLLAHSLGAAIASIYAGTFPEKILKLILIEGIGPMTMTEDESVGQLAKSIKERNRHKDRDKQYFENLDLIINARSKLTDLDKENVALLVERNMKLTAEGYHWRSDPHLRLPTPMYLTHKQSKAFINKLTMPVILFYGKQGFVHKYPAIKERIADCEAILTVELDGGHHLHMEYPEQLANGICSFMRR